MQHKRIRFQVKLPKVKLKTGQKGFYFLGAKVFN